MTREKRFQTSILYGGDMAAILISWASAYWLRFHSGWIGLPLGKEGLVVHPADIYFAPVLISLICFSWALRKSVYPAAFSAKWAQEVRALFYAFLTAGPVLIAVT